ncbi:hypothetical protein Bca101_035992 [Brassica carinata]
MHNPNNVREDAKLFAKRVLDFFSELTLKVEKTTSDGFRIILYAAGEKKLGKNTLYAMVQCLELTLDCKNCLTWSTTKLFKNGDIKQGARVFGSNWLAKMRDIILPSHGKKEYQVQVLMDGNLLKLEAKIQVEFTKSHQPETAKPEEHVDQMKENNRRPAYYSAVNEAHTLNSTRRSYFKTAASKCHKLLLLPDEMGEYLGCFSEGHSHIFRGESIPPMFGVEEDAVATVTDPAVMRFSWCPAPPTEELSPMACTL